MYIALVGLVLIGLSALPLVRIPVTIQSAGMIRPVVETHEVLAPAGGIVEAIRVRSNQNITAGTELVRIEDPPLFAELNGVEESLSEIEREISDLQLLSTSSPTAKPPLQTAELIAEHIRYKNETRAVALRIEHARVAQGRLELLTSLGVAAPAELNDQIQRVAQLEAELVGVESGYRIDWGRRIQAGRERIRDLATRRSELKERIAELIVRAPIDGSVEEIMPLSPGSIVQPGRMIARISPAAAVRAEVLVPPKDIGLLRIGLPARLAIDAYNHHDWGFLTGSIAEISEDVAMVDGQPRYRVGVAIEGDGLVLPGGARGHIRKGMTLQVRFLVAERTLFQLLRDDVDGWINPLANPA